MAADAPPPEAPPRCSYCGDIFDGVDPQDFTLSEGRWWCGCDAGMKENDEPEK